MLEDEEKWLLNVEIYNSSVCVSKLELLKVNKNIPLIRVIDKKNDKKCYLETDNLA